MQRHAVRLRNLVPPIRAKATRREAVEAANNSVSRRKTRPTTVQSPLARFRYRRPGCNPKGCANGWSRYKAVCSGTTDGYSRGDARLLKRYRSSGDRRRRWTSATEVRRLRPHPTNRQTHVDALPLLQTLAMEGVAGRRSIAQARSTSLVPIRACHDEQRYRILLQSIPLCPLDRWSVSHHYDADASGGSEEQSLVGGVNGTLPLGDRSFLTNDTGFGDELTGTSMANNMLPPSRAPPPLPDSLATTPVTPNIHSHASAWAHMYRWQQKERMDENGVTLRGQFVAVGLLADAVHDGQNVCIDWDIANEVSFALIRQPDPEQICEEVWLYNSGNKPLFISVSSSLNSHKAETIRRLSSGYCYRVHKFAARNVSATRLIESDPANTHYFLNISVGKGWGSNYHRIYHTDTPCRYEVIFVPDFL